MFAFYAAFPSQIYSRFNQTAVYLTGAYMICYVIFFFIGLHRRVEKPLGSGKLLTVAGGMAAICLSLADMLRYRHGADINLLQTGMLIFIYVVMLGMALEQQKTELELAEASSREKEILHRNSALIEQAKMRTGFMADISHELRTPLTVISSYAGLTKMQIESGAVDIGTIENLDIIQHEAVRLGNLTEQIKSTSAERERREEETVCDLRSLMSEAKRFCAPICEKNGNTIRLIVPNEPVYIITVSEGIFQVLYNLITNASRHSRDGIITLSCITDGDMAITTVADMGTGMDEATAKRAFERGFSGDGSSGIGLALCRSIIEDHGGTISLKSTLGSGTEVSFWLPLITEADI